MKPEDKEKLVKLLWFLEEEWFESMCLEAMFQAIEDGDPAKCVSQATNWRENLEKMKKSSLREESRAKFRLLIDEVLAANPSDDIEGILRRLFPAMTWKN